MKRLEEWFWNLPNWAVYLVLIGFVSAFWSAIILMINKLW
jgi:hypothetical protein